MAREATARTGRGRACGLLLVGYGLAAACGSPPPKPPKRPPAPVVVVLDLAARRDIHWGYGCGGNCAISHTGRSSLALVLSSDKTARVVDSGTVVLEDRSPAGSMANTEWWRYAWAGTWRGPDDARELELRPKAMECHASRAVTDDTGTRTTEADCQPPPAQLALTCALEDVTVEDIPPDGNVTETLPPTDQHAWVCRGQPGLEGRGGTELPWVFGYDVPIRTVVAGEPEPKTTYVLDPGGAGP